MITRVVLAKLSPTMEEGTVVKWMKQEGEAVKVGDVLAEIETDKANMEMEALGAGVLRKILVAAGGKAPVGALIGVIAGAEEDIAAALATAAPAPPPPAEAAAVAPPSVPQAKAAAPAPAPAATPRPAAAAAPPAPPPPAASPSPVVPFPAPEPGGRVKASPLARAMAQSQNIPLTAVPGTGPGGRIIKRDIEGYAGAPGSRPAAAPAPRPAAPAITPGQELPLSGMRRTIARRLSESKFSAPHFYVTVEIDMDAAVGLREQLLRGDEIKVSFNDLIVKACAKALTRFPGVNASWGEDRIVTHAEVHVGVAVSLPDGLITPVVRNADRKHLVEISREVKDLAARARERKLRPEEFTGSTFTVSNLGMFDVASFTAIINPPESAILAVGAVRKTPVVVGEALGVGHRMSVTLSSDHRVVDGALAAQFLGEVRRLLENPAALLV
jgi:pyruvate dehydrogenase E2 component (dihydrolipoamide acetyltransferase)